MAHTKSVGPFGPIVFTLTTSGNTTWVPIAPCLPNKVSLTATFTGTTGIVKLQGIGSTASTGTPTAVASRTYAQRSVTIASTVATPTISYLRCNTTSIQAGKVIRAVVGIVQ